MAKSGHMSTHGYRCFQVITMATNGYKCMKLGTADYMWLQLADSSDEWQHKWLQVDVQYH